MPLFLQLVQTLGFKKGEPSAQAVAPALLASSIPTFRRSIPSIEAELRRARRYERPMAALVLTAVSDSAPEVVGQAGRAFALPSSAPRESPHTLFFLLGALLQDTMREFDIVTYAAEYNVYALFLPETDEVQARIAAMRISDLFAERVDAHLRAGVASFPKDSFTARDLFDHAREEWQDNPVLFPHPSQSAEEVSGARA